MSSTNIHRFTRAFMGPRNTARKTNVWKLILTLIAIFPNAHFLQIAMELSVCALKTYLV